MAPHVKPGSGIEMHDFVTVVMLLISGFLAVTAIRALVLFAAKLIRECYEIIAGIRRSSDLD
jgi:hypothetical protein